MKTRIFTVAFALTLGLLMFTTSCDKLKDKLFQAFTTNGVEQDFVIPIINTTTGQVDFGTIRDQFNIDSIIKAESGGAFSLNDIKKVTITEAKLILLNADADNNFQNFEEGWLNFNTNTNPTTVEIATGLNPDVYSEQWLLPPLTGVNLKDYLNGSELNYFVAGKARKVTTKALNCKLKVKFYVEN